MMFLTSKIMTSLFVIAVMLGVLGSSIPLVSHSGGLATNCSATSRRGGRPMVVLDAMVKLACAFGLILLAIAAAKAVFGPLLAAHAATSAEIDAEVAALFGPTDPPAPREGPP